MTREEAIKTIMSATVWTDEEREALATLIPELKESEDERIRKALVWHLKADADFVSNGVTKAECIAYLEKLKEQDLAEMDKSKSPLSVAYANRCFENGKQAMKEQMLKDAVEGFIFQAEDYYPKELIANYNGELKHGDKVRIIIVKEDEK